MQFPYRRASEVSVISRVRKRERYALVMPSNVVVWISMIANPGHPSVVLSLLWLQFPGSCKLCLIQHQRNSARYRTVCPTRPASVHARSVHLSF